MKRDPVKVIYIAGDSRSGSTLLGLMLGQLPGFFCAGEVRYLPQRGLMENQLCGCGAAFGDCLFWHRAIQAGFGGLDAGMARHLYRLQLVVDQPRSVFRNAFFSPRRFTASYRRHRQQYLRHLGRLFSGIRQATDCEFVVDSSKVPSHGMMLGSMAGIDLHVIHMVRDCRAVAFSMLRRKRRPDIRGVDMYMATYPPWRAALRWVMTNAACERLKLVGGGCSFVRYEDLISDPVATIRVLLNDLGWPHPSLDFISGMKVHLAPNHTVAGNPMRFRSGDVDLILDEQWRDQMPPRQVWPVTIVSGHQMRRYGYMSGGA